MKQNRPERTALTGASNGNTLGEGTGAQSICGGNMPHFKRRFVGGVWCAPGSHKHSAPLPLAGIWLAVVEREE